MKACSSISSTSALSPLREDIAQIAGTYSNHLAQLPDHLRADQEVNPIMKGIAKCQMSLFFRHWQILGIDHLSGKPVSVSSLWTLVSHREIRQMDQMIITGPCHLEQLCGMVCYFFCSYRRQPSNFPTERVNTFIQNSGVHIQIPQFLHRAEQFQHCVSVFRIDITRGVQSVYTSCQISLVLLSFEMPPCIKLTFTKLILKPNGYSFSFPLLPNGFWRLLLPPQAHIASQKNAPSTTPVVHLIKKAQAVSSEEEYFPEPRNTEEWDVPSEFLNHLERQRSHAYLHFLKNVTYFRLQKKQNIQETQFYLTKIFDD